MVEADETGEMDDLVVLVGRARLASNDANGLYSRMLKMCR